MKTATDPRHQKRIKLIKALYSLSYRPKQSAANPTLDKIIKNLNLIDNIISKSAPEWPIKQINRIDLAILRLAVYELMVAKKEPPKVILDEAIELGKNYGAEKSASFINGVLGTILKNETAKL